MTCYSLRDNGRHVGFMCGDLGDPCRECGAVADFLCDFPVGEGKTCDRPICEEHAAEIGPEVHYCQVHHAEWTGFRQAGGVRQQLENVVPYRPAHEKPPVAGSLHPDQRPVLQLKRLRHLLRAIPRTRAGVAKVFNLADHEAEELLRFLTQESPR